MAQKQHLPARLQAHLVASGLLLPPQEGQSLAVACSGGADSVALTHLLVELGYKPALLHIHHGLRQDGTASADQAFVQALAQELHLPFATTQLEGLKAQATAKNRSPQEAARHARYAWLEAQPYVPIALAHHADDQLETILWSLLRGASHHLLQAMPAQRGKYVRPLLPFQKEELLAYLQAHGHTWRDDPTNAQAHYARNHLRLHILPRLLEANPKLPAHLLERAAHYQAQQAQLQRLYTHWQALYVRPDASGTHLLTNALSTDHGPEALHLWLPWLLEELYALPAGPRRQVLKLISSPAGQHVAYHGLRIERSARGLFVSQATSSLASSLTLTQDGAHTLGPHSLRLSTLPTKAISLPPPTGTQYLALPAAAYPLTLRCWQDGDALQPLGLGGTKLVSDILKEAGLHGQAKQHALVLEKDGTILWVHGLRIAQGARITPATTSVLKVEPS